MKGLIILATAIVLLWFMSYPATRLVQRLVYRLTVRGRAKGLEKEDGSITFRFGDKKR